MTNHYPSWILFRARHSDNVPARVLADEYMMRLRQLGLLEIASYGISGMDAQTHGRYGDLIRGLDERQRSGADDGAFIMDFGFERFSFTRGEGGRPFWDVEGRYPPETKPTAEWVRRMAELGTVVPTVPGFHYAVLRREQSSTQFVPEPPLARANHLVTTNEREVADDYDDPDYFWKAWDRIEQVGDIRVCIRALEALDDDSWLSETFESTMDLVRRAKPKFTNYVRPGRVEPEFAPWWEYGDYQYERAGNPALSYVGYEAATRTVEYTGFVAKLPYVPSRTDSNRHVLIREIHGLRALVKAKQDAEGRPIDTVRIVFPFEWMARQERRPLLDAGARVFYSTADSVDLIEVTD